LAEIYAQGYGLADLEAMTPVTADTAFHIASVSKIVTGTAMMMLLEQGAYGLDDPIDRFVDFPVVHPKFPDVPITFRHLFTHSSGISDAVYYEIPKFSVSGDPSLPLRDFLSGYLSAGGRWYDSEGSYTPYNPGSAWRYSNVAVALLGYLAGRVGPNTLDVLTRNRIFQPLRMRNTAWKIADVRPASLALPYSYVDERYQQLPPTGYPDWPAGMLRTSPRDFAHFLSLFTNQGVVDNTRYLKSETLQLFLTPQQVIVSETKPSSRQALIWHLHTMGSESIADRAGGDPGAAAIVSIDPVRRTGALAFANISAGKPVQSFLGEVNKRLREKARSA